MAAALDTLTAHLSAPADAAHRCRQVDAAALPAPYDRLLDHHDHMTTTLERFFGSPVTLTVLELYQTTSEYTRLIELTPTDMNRVVEFGIARLDLTAIPQAARDEIVAARAPLGDILIRHDVLREIEPLWFLEVDAASPIIARFGPQAREAYGRIGVIHCNGRPAIELLEIVSA